MPDPVISITAEDIPIFWKAVEISMGQAAGDPLRFCASFFESALALTRGKMKRMTSKDHDLDYRDVSAEYLMWAVGILSTTWTIETLRRRTRDGDCKTHRDKYPEKKACAGAAEFHGQIYEDCKASFEQLIQHLEARNLKSPDPPLSP